jgi:hypothetical protein
MEMNSRLFRLALFVPMVATTVTASAIIRRHDLDDAKYLELGVRYPAVTKLAGGNATLIEPQWLITAGHVVASLTPFDRSVEFNGKRYPIDAVATHPEWRPNGRLKSLDLALVKLSEPVTAVEPAAIYEKRDEDGRAVVFIGTGKFGDGLTGPTGDDGHWRGATNTVTSVLDNWVTFSFDRPPNGTALEGISGPGDSGGPAFVELDGKNYVIGISSANDDEGAAGPCRYGSTEYYARVSTGADWIRKTVESDLPRQQSFDLTPIDLSSGEWPRSRVGQVAAAFFDAYGRGSDESMESFEQTYRSVAALEARPVKDRLEDWRKQRSEWGTLEALKCVPGGVSELFVLVRAHGEGVSKTFRFMLEADEPYKLTGIEISSPTASDE